MTKASQRWKAGDEPDEDWTDTHEGTIHVSFLEPFIVAEDADNCFFITKGGRLYFAEMPHGEDDETKAQELWQEDRPILAVISQADTYRTVAFGKDFWFELSEQLKPQTLEKVSLPRDPKIPDSVIELLEYARSVPWPSGKQE